VTIVLILRLSDHLPNCARKILNTQVFDSRFDMFFDSFVNRKVGSNFECVIRSVSGIKQIRHQLISILLFNCPAQKILCFRGKLCPSSLLDTTHPSVPVMDGPVLVNFGLDAQPLGRLQSRIQQLINHRLFSHVWNVLLPHLQRKILANVSMDTLIRVSSGKIFHFSSPDMPAVGLASVWGPRFQVACVVSRVKWGNRAQFRI